MDIQALKEYIYQNNYIEQILESIECHHIINRGEYWTCGNKDGDNPRAITVKNNENLYVTNYTRTISNRQVTDIIDLVMYNANVDIVQALKIICELIEIDYYHDFAADLPESLLLTKSILAMASGSDTETEEAPLNPLSTVILSYYLPYVNELFFKDNITYETQREFRIGYDPETNYITIPIYSELGDLVGVKGRLFQQKINDTDLKYMYLEPCPRRKILYGLHKTKEYIHKQGRVYVVEAEKGVMQLWSMGTFNSVAAGGKKLSQNQLDLLVRLGVNIIFAFDKDVTIAEIEELANRIPIPIYYLYDDENILSEKESPTDNKEKWEYLIKNNLYKTK